MELQAPVPPVIQLYRATAHSSNLVEIDELPNSSKKTVIMLLCGIFVSMNGRPNAELFVLHIERETYRTVLLMWENTNSNN